MLQVFYKSFFSDEMKLDGTGDNDYKVTLSQGALKIKALNCSVIIDSLKEESIWWQYS